MDIHDAITEVFVALGYTNIDEGCCHGFALRWLEANLAGEEELFYARVNQIITQGKNLIAAINQTQAKKGRNLTQEDKALLNILAFFDSIKLYQFPEEHSALFNRSSYLNQEDFEKISTLAASDTIHSLGNLAKVYSTSLIYNQAEIKQYLDDLSEILEQPPTHFNKKVGVLLVNYEHAVALTYTLGVGWQHMDINQYSREPFKIAETALVAKKLIDGWKNHDSPYIAFSASVITPGNTPELARLKEKLHQLDTKHQITPELAQRTEQVNLAMIATLQGNAKLVDAAARRGAKLEISDKTGSITTHLAAQKGFHHIIEVLAKYKVNLDVADEDGQTAAHFAAAAGHHHVIASLARNNANLNHRKKNGWTPTLLAINKNMEHVVAECIKFGADLTTTITLPIGSLNSTNPDVQLRLIMWLIQRLTLDDKQGMLTVNAMDIAYILGHTNMSTLLSHASEIHTLYQQVLALINYSKNQQTPPQMMEWAKQIESSVNEFIRAIYTPHFDMELKETYDQLRDTTHDMYQAMQHHGCDRFLKNIDAATRALAKSVLPNHGNPKRNRFFHEPEPQPKRLHLDVVLPKTILAKH